MRVPAFARRQVVSLSSTALALLISSAGPLRAPAEAPAAAPAPAALPETYPDPNKRNRGMMNEKVLVPRDYYGVFGVVPPRVLVQVDAKQPQWNAWGSCVDNSCTYVPLKQRYHGLGLGLGLGVGLELGLGLGLGIGVGVGVGLG